MRLLLLLSFLNITSVCSAQDYPDYRSKKEIFTRVTEKPIRDDVASFSMGGIDEIIGKLPLKTLPITGTGHDFISFGGNNMQVKITAGTFDPTKHKLGYYDGKYLTRIDNKPYFGDYGKVPKTTIENVTVIIERDTIAILKEAYFDLYNPIFTYSENGAEKSLNNVYLSNDGHRVYVYMIKQEAGGSYEVTWVIQDRKYVRRIVDFGFLK